MCHDNRFNNSNRHPNGRHAPHNHPDCDGNHAHHHDHNPHHHSYHHEHQGPHKQPDPVECLKMSMLDITEEAFQELVKEKVKLQLEDKIGQKIAELAEEIVDFYVKTKEAELQHYTDADDLDSKIREKL